MDRVTASFPEQSATVILGANGAGKTTLFDVVTGYLRPERGEVLLEGRQVTGLAPHILAAKGLGRLFQEPRVFARLTVEENLLVAAAGQPEESVVGGILHRGRVEKSESRAKEAVAEVLARFRLQEKARDSASTLSFGQQRLVSLARLLLADCRVLLLDEPAAGIYEETRLEIAGVLRQLRDEGRTILIVDHDPEASLEFADQVLLLEDGRLVAEAAGEEVGSNARIADYLRGCTNG